MIKKAITILWLYVPVAIFSQCDNYIATAYSDDPFAPITEQASISCDGSVMVWTEYGANSLVVRNGVVLSDNGSGAHVSCDGSTVVWNEFDNGVTHIYQDGVQISGGLNSFAPIVSCNGETIIWVGDDEMGVRSLYKNGVAISQSIGNYSTSHTLSEDGTTVVWVGLDDKVYKNGLVISTGSTQNYYTQTNYDGSIVVWIGRDLDGTRKVFKNGQVISDSFYDSSYIVDSSCDGDVITWISQETNGTQHVIVNGSSIFSDSNFIIDYVSISCDGSTIVWSGVDINDPNVTTVVYKNGVIISDGLLLGPSVFAPAVSCDGSAVLWDGIAISGSRFSHTDCCTISELQAGPPVLNPDGTYSVTVSYLGSDSNIIVSGGLNASPATQLASATIDCSAGCQPLAGSVTFTYPACTEAQIFFSGDCGHSSIPISTTCVAIPTLGEWGLICLGIFILIVGVVSIKRLEYSMINSK